MKAGFATPLSSVTGQIWPALPHAAGQTMLATQFQLERSQWWPAEVLAEHQLTQLRSLAAHAIRQAPHYRDTIARHLPEVAADAKALNWENFARWPILKKSELREKGNTLLASSPPPDHGGLSWNFTSGSTGTPTRCALTLVSHFFRSALVLRHHFWNDVDFALKYVNIRPDVPAHRSSGWGPGPNAAFETGPSVILPINSGLDAQLDSLLEEDPGYLQSTASNLRALVLHSRDTGRRPASLDGVFSYAENLPSDLRALVREVWGTRLIDAYSCTEAGTVALQCPKHDHYHVQSEVVLVEVLHDDGTPCAPGEVGRVVLTDLVNFGMPLIRYEIGDYAEVGPPCDCGRGLPVLKRIAGRHRNMAVDPTGRVFWPTYPTAKWYDIAPVRQVQMVQHTPASIEVRYVKDQDLNETEKAALTRVITKEMEYPFEMRYNRVESILRKPGEKYEEFISLCLPEA